MHRFMGEFEAENGHIDISMRDTSRWKPWPIELPGFNMTSLLIGDAKAGPFLSLASVPPRDEPLKKSPAHGHYCDSWRIAIRGTLTVGNRRYGPGEFRLQQGGRSYGADDYAWGPDGGYSVIMMSDRRGPAKVPVRPELLSSFRASEERIYEWLGIESPGDYASSSSMVTTLGLPGKGGNIEGSFATGDRWRSVTAGTRATVAFVGDREVGPVIVSSVTRGGAEAFPASTWGTEVLHLVVAGSATIGGTELLEADLRLVEAGSSGDKVVAGPGGLQEVVLFGSRGWLSEDLRSGAVIGPWADTLTAAWALLEP